MFPVKNHVFGQDFPILLSSTELNDELNPLKIIMSRKKGPFQKESLRTTTFEGILGCPRKLVNG